MSSSVRGPARLASEDVIINAPLSYAGSAQRIIRLRRRAPDGWQLIAITILALVLIVAVWLFVTAWYLTWGLLLVPYRVLRRGARKRKVDALRHRELMGTIEGSAAASAAAVVAATMRSGTSAEANSSLTHQPAELVGDSDREQVISALQAHMLAGRLSAEEFEQRLASAHRARTRADLALVAENLPLASLSADN